MVLITIESQGDIDTIAVTGSNLLFFKENKYNVFEPVGRY
ncbi:hypothetical protein KKH3_08320 [Pectobacterium actinidiae]|nr:hypothetical protein KKH3_08320 [Pectobacterium actinidiae]